MRCSRRAIVAWAPCSPWGRPGHDLQRRDRSHGLEATAFETASELTAGATSLQIHHQSRDRSRGRAISSGRSRGLQSDGLRNHDARRAPRRRFGAAPTGAATFTARAAFTIAAVAALLRGASAGRDRRWGDLRTLTVGATAFTTTELGAASAGATFAVSGTAGLPGPRSPSRGPSLRASPSRGPRPSGRGPPSR